MKILIALVLALTIAAAITTPAVHAQTCDVRGFPQHDMAGTYLDAFMRVEIYPCGGTAVMWDNAFGRHAAAYASVRRADTGGYIAHGLTPDPNVGYLDDAWTIGFKPAEPGYIQVITMNRYGNIVGVYRLRKTA